MIVFQRLNLEVKNITPIVVVVLQSKFDRLHDALLDSYLKGGVAVVIF